MGAMQIRIVLVKAVAVLKKMNVVPVIVMPPMTVLRIVQVHGVVHPKLMSAVYVEVITVPVWTVQVFQMVVH